MADKSLINSQGKIQTNFTENTIVNTQLPIKPLIKQRCGEKAVASFGLIKDILEKCTQKCCAPAR